MKTTLSFLIVLVCLVATTTAQDKFERAAWTTSQFQGEPEPPLPYVLERVFEDIPLRNPTEMVRVPGTDRWLVVQMRGDLVSFRDQQPRDVRTALSPKELESHWRTYAIVFHPDYPTNKTCFIQYSTVPKDVNGTRLSRFTVTDVETPTIDPASEEVLMTWSSVDHMGGSLHFGTDGYLYFSIGDGQRPNPPDPAGTGQDISDLQASIIRIDVDGKQAGLRYKIPYDNPFVNSPGARGEVWAFGVRNPWKMAFRPGTSELWAADVGWEMKEMIYRVERGSNYGWSTMEGSQPIKLDPNERHEVPISAPTFEYDHTEGRSISGGYFWQSDRLPELKDAYLYGDFVSGKVWGLKHDGEKVTWQKLLANTPLQVICFANDSDGELLVLAFDGGIYRVMPNPVASDANLSFPKKLSETGLFASVKDETPAPGVVPYSINAHHWADHTTSKQWFAIPNREAKIGIYKREKYDYGQVKGYFDFPTGMVFAKTVSYRADQDDPTSVRRLETQILHRLDRDWRAYNYIWNDEQTDAFLQDATAKYSELEIRDQRAPDGIRKQKWLHASRDQCMMCHIWRAGSVIGFKAEQINRVHLGESLNQIDKLEKMNYFKVDVPRRNPAVDKQDTSATLEDRARRYLDLNCAHCHRPGGGGSSPFFLQAERKELSELNLIGTPVYKGDFGIKEACVVAPGRPEKSALLYRMAKHGPGRMPKFGTNVLDQTGIKLVHDWIESMDRDAKSEERPDLESMNQFLHSLNESLGDQAIQDEIDALTDSTESALLFSIRLGEPDVAISAQQLVAQHVRDHPREEVRDLFERFLPIEERIERLGPNIDPQALLAVPGDAKRGAKLFFESSFNCRTCHQIHGKGRMVGPDLSKLGSQRSRQHILSSLLEPSREIDEKYRGFIVMTVDGEIFSGLKIEDTDDQVTIVDIEGNKRVVKVDDIDEIRAMDKSVMPDALLESFTRQQAADLLAYLSSLK